MTTPETPGYPACFPSNYAFQQWKASAKRAKECASPCDDCHPAYKHRAGVTCNETLVKTLFTIVPKGYKPEAIETTAKDDEL